MRPYIILIAVINFLFACTDKPTVQNGTDATAFALPGTKEEVIKSFPDGKKQLAVYKDENTNEKLAEVEFHQDGKTYLEKHFKNDKLNGESYSYYPDGSKWSLNTYKDGQYHGPWKLWWPNGAVRLEANYENGLETGEWFFYHENGKIDTRGIYVAGKKTGVWTSYNPDGSLAKEIDYSKEK